ncbi:MAG: glycerol-3-phosphate 1-O-acyltransferase PlsY [Chlamydiae bacterium]|nr:glycerol-3-phosphate 1-O-acyltransferase PlsY [Chlamydiota bacterium]MBI3277082.1 glycerol-3-phosphate 1-O-acyltransferase PlsY [Chlamydiota bacterium]
MIDFLKWTGALLTSYLVGSIPTGYLLGKILKGVDIRQHGSGNMGATNVMRVLGKKLGILTLLIDIGKGLISVLIIAPFWGSGLIHQSLLQLSSGIASIFGHNWTCFLKFKGGKGVATSLGVFLGLAPQATLCLLVIWGVVLFLTRTVSIASIIASMALPLLLFLFGKPIEWVIGGLFLSWISIWKHQGNIRRLMAGTEPKIGKSRIEISKIKN